MLAMKKTGAGRCMVFCAGIILLLFILMAAAGAEKKGTVHGGWLILRDAPSFQGRELASYPSGTVVKITGQKGSWYAVKTPDGLEGFMLSNYLTVSGTDVTVGESAWVTSTNGLNVRLRTGPGTQYTAIASYAPGTKCTVLAKSGSFYQIRVGKYTGYMMGKYLTGISPSIEKEPDENNEEKISALYDIYVTSGNGEGVNLRLQPSRSSVAIGFFQVGTKGEMLVPGKNWSQISIGGLEGYMMTKYLTTQKPDSNEQKQKDAGKEYYVYCSNGKRVNLRSGPGTDYSSLGSYANGTKVTVVNKGDLWYFVKINETYGYMMKDYIRKK